MLLNGDIKLNSEAETIACFFWRLFKILP